MPKVPILELGHLRATTTVAKVHINNCPHPQSLLWVHRCRGERQARGWGSHSRRGGSIYTIAASGLFPAPAKKIEPPLLLWFIPMLVSRLGTCKLQKEAEAEGFIKDYPCTRILKIRDETLYCNCFFACLFHKINHMSYVSHILKSIPGKRYELIERHRCSDLRYQAIPAPNDE